MSPDEGLFELVESMQSIRCLFGDINNSLGCKMKKGRKNTDLSFQYSLYIEEISDKVTGFKLVFRIPDRLHVQSSNDVTMIIQRQ